MPHATGFVATRFLRAALGVTLALLSLACAAPARAQSAEPLQIGIIGTGRIGSALATHWARAGHELVISSRHPEQLQELAQQLGPKVRTGTPREAAEFGAVVLVSIPYGATPQLGRDLGDVLNGKVVLDTGNPYPQRDGAMAEAARAKGAGLASQEFLPGTRLVRAFNAISYVALKDEAFRAGERYAIPLAGNDAGALAVAERLVRDAGFDPVVVGDLASAKQFDVGAPVYVKLMTAAELRAALGL